MEVIWAGSRSQPGADCVLAEMSCSPYPPNIPMLHGTSRCLQTQRLLQTSCVLGLQEALQNHEQQAYLLTGRVLINGSKHVYFY